MPIRQINELCTPLFANFSEKTPPIAPRQHLFGKIFYLFFPHIHNAATVAAPEEMIPYFGSSTILTVATKPDLYDAARYAMPSTAACTEKATAATASHFCTGGQIVFPFSRQDAKKWSRNVPATTPKNIAQQEP